MRPASEPGRCAGINNMNPILKIKESDIQLYADRYSYQINEDDIREKGSVRLNQHFP